MLFLFIVIPEGCERGITIASYGNQNQRIINEANYSGNTRDIHFKLSFCPEESGVYNITYEGSIDSGNEGTWSGYIFNGTRQKSRVFKNLELREGLCYQVWTGHSTCCGYAWGRLGYTHNGVTKLFSSDDSFSCPIGWCKNGGEFPQCLTPPTIKFTEQESKLNRVLTLLLALFLAQ